MRIASGDRSARMNWLFSTPLMSFAVMLNGKSSLERCNPSRLPSADQQICSAVDAAGHLLPATEWELYT